jgi:hypothetical protein
MRGKKIFAWNLNSEVAIIGLVSMVLQNRIKFPDDITASLTISN